MITIKDEAISRAKLVTDLDNFREHYITDTELFKFPSPSMWTLEKNRFYLLSNSRKEILNAKYIMRPDYLSYDEYGTETLWPVLLFVNQCFCREEFDMQEVIIPSLESIIIICKDKFPKKNTNELTSINW